MFISAYSDRESDSFSLMFSCLIWSCTVCIFNLLMMLMLMMKLMPMLMMLILIMKLMLDYDAEEVNAQ